MARSKVAKSNRVVTNEDIKKYTPLVNKFLRDSVARNWNESYDKTKKGDEVLLGNTGMTMEDFRQYLYSEVVVALQKYDPNYRTKDGKSVMESSFVYTNLSNRIGQMMKRLTKMRQGYGLWAVSIDELTNDRIEE